MNKENKGYRNLIAWQSAHKLAHLIYDITEKFPKAELFGLTSQIRRAGISVGANIAEGYMRSSGKEKVRFFNISLSSLTEVEYGSVPRHSIHSRGQYSLTHHQA
ncbi:MAG: four helix bundle protein [Candidatus Curtissbacteria bacterium]|nr:four helix bundle protein [Candidatus Curtissbacteria bacterium]